MSAERIADIAAGVRHGWMSAREDVELRVQALKGPAERPREAQRTARLQEQAVCDRARFERAARRLDGDSRVDV